MTLKPYWPALILALIPAACLGWGMLTGKIPQRYGLYDRQSDAAGFWMMVAAWTGLLAILLWIGLRI